MGKITSIQVKTPKEAILPDGVYTGIMGGYVIELSYNGKTYELVTKEGVKDIGIKVMVTVNNGIATYEFIKN